MSAAIPSGDLRFQLTTLFNWTCVTATRSAVEQLETIGRSKTLRPVTFKRVLREAHGAARQGIDAVAMDEIEDFLAGPSRSWKDIADFGSALRDRFKESTRRRNRSGLAIDDYLVSIGQLMVLGSVVNVLLSRSHRVVFPAFCEFCWRVTLTNQRYCRIHHAHGTSVAGPLSPPGDSYWLGRRLKPAFDGGVNQMRRSDKGSRVISEWLLALNAGTERHWLAKHRPAVFAATAASLLRGGGGSAVHRLVSSLDADSTKKDDARRSFHEQLCKAANERYVYEMTLRAEAWLTAFQSRSSAHGGARAGAGRKRVDQTPERT